MEQAEDIADALDSATAAATVRRAVKRPSAAKADDALSKDANLSSFTEAVIDDGTSDEATTELYRLELPARIMAWCMVRFTLPDGRLARLILPDPVPEQPFMNVRVPKGPHRPAASIAARLHPDNILKGEVVHEAMEGGVETEAHIAAMAAKASPSEIKAVPIAPEGDADDQPGPPHDRGSWQRGSCRAGERGIE